LQNVRRTQRARHNDHRPSSIIIIFIIIIIDLPTKPMAIGLMICFIR
jgi:hypothetical protein